MKYLVYDLGHYIGRANALANNGKNQVMYFTDYYRVMPEWRDYAFGLNFGNLKKTKYPEDYIKESDCIVNFDCYNQSFIHFLKQIYPNKSVFGSGLGARLEDNREELRKLIDELKLPSQRWKKIIGISALREFIKSNPDKYVKMNIFRGSAESFYAKNYEEIKLKLVQMENEYGPNSEEIPFVLEEVIDSDIEIGADGFFNKYGFVGIYGYEYHKALYIGITDKPLPKPLKETMDKLTPTLKALDYRSAISTEEKIVKNNHYFLDLTARLADPLSAIYSEPSLLENFPEIVYKIGKNEPVKPKWKYKYVFCMPLESNAANDNYLKIDVKPKDLDKVKFRWVCCDKQGNFYAIKGMNSVVVLVAGANNIDEGLKKLKEYGDLVQADGLDKDDLNGMDIIKDIIKNGEKINIPFN